VRGKGLIERDRGGDPRHQFLDWFNGSALIDPVLKAALAHLWFVTVHPFDDGNGRIARAIADLALARSERSPKRFYASDFPRGFERVLDSRERQQQGKRCVRQRDRTVR